MGNLDTLFRASTAGIDHRAEEVSIFNGLVEENLFDARKAPRELLVELIHCIGLHFQEGVNLEELEQFSFQAADGVFYKEDKLMLVYSGGEAAAKRASSSIKKAHEHYCINYFLESKSKKTKFYDLMIHEHSHPALPPGSYYAAPFGLGVSEDGQRKDVYFVHKNLPEVARFFSLPEPSVAELSFIDQDHSVEKVFGLSYEATTLQPVKLKRYFYPADPYLKSILYDEVNHHDS